MPGRRFAMNLYTTSGARRVAMLAYPQLVLLDLVGPCEVFSMANRIARRLRGCETDTYTLETLSVDSDLRLQASSGISLMADRSWRDCHGNIDTLLISGGIDMQQVTQDEALLQWVNEMAPRVRRIGSICTGAFVL